MPPEAPLDEYSGGSLSSRRPVGLAISSLLPLRPSLLLLVLLLPSLFAPVTLVAGLGNPVYYEAPQSVKGPAAGSDFGWLVFMNGNTMLVGADSYNGKRGQIGIYQCEGTKCDHQSDIASPAPTSSPQSLFGQSIGSVGTLMAAGAPAQTPQQTVYLYDISSLTHPVLKYSLTQPQTARFGTALCMYKMVDTKDVILVISDNLVNYGMGALYVYVLPGGDPTMATLVATLTDDTSSSLTPEFGYPVIESSGHFATSSQGAGRVYVYTCTPQAGTTIGCSLVGGIIVDPDLTNEAPTTGQGQGQGQLSSYFGYMLAIEMDSTVEGTLIVGAFGADNGVGAAYVYHLLNNVWSLSQTLHPLSTDMGSGGLLSAFGAGVALTAGTAVIAASQGNGGQGSLYVYYCRHGQCSDLVQYIKCDDYQACQKSGFGDNALALSATATFLAVGGRYADGGYIINPPSQGQPETINALGSGAVWIYSTAPTFAPTARLTNPTAVPTLRPTPHPTPFPTEAEAPHKSRTTFKPTMHPSAMLTLRPSALPSAPAPTNKPQVTPTLSPTTSPSSKLRVPSVRPSPSPTTFYSSSPSLAPSSPPTSNNSSIAHSPSQQMQPQTPHRATTSPTAILAASSINSSGSSSSANKTAGWVYAVAILLSLLAVALLAAYYRYVHRKGSITGLLTEDGNAVGRRPTDDKRTPYEMWTQYQDAKAAGKLEDYVPPAEVANPTPPQVLIPGYVDPTKRQSVVVAAVKRLSVHLGLSADLINSNPDGQTVGAELKDVTMSKKKKGATTDEAGVFDERGSAAMRMDRLYGGDDSDAPPSPDKLRSLDRLEDGTSAAGVRDSSATSAITTTTAAAATSSAPGSVPAPTPALVPVRRASIEYNPMLFKK